MNETLERRIRERAYEIWTTTGREHGRAEEHWFSAERQLLASARPRRSVKTVKKSATGKPVKCPRARSVSRQQYEPHLGR